jgi:hypothetical protein
VRTSGYRRSGGVNKPETPIPQYSCIVTMALRAAGRGNVECAEQDVTKLDDPDLLAERRRVRGELEANPTAELTAHYERLDAEFMRRAGIAWNRAKP